MDLHDPLLHISCHTCDGGNGHPSPPPPPLPSSPNLLPHPSPPLPPYLTRLLPPRCPSFYPTSSPPHFLLHPSPHPSSYSSFAAITSSLYIAIYVYMYIVPTMSTELLYPLQYGYTPLHLAAMEGHTTCVECLLSTPDIDVNIENEVS